MKRTILIALGAVIMGSMLAYAQSVYRGDINLIDNSAGTSQYQVGGEDIIKALTFPIIDSLASNSSVIAVITLPRAILVKQVDIYTSDAYLGPDPDSACTATLRSTAMVATGTLDSGETFNSTNITDVAFTAAAQCTVVTTDGGGTCTGGALGQVTFWYTDD